MDLDAGLKADVKWVEDALARYQFSSIEAMHKRHYQQAASTTRRINGVAVKRKVHMVGRMTNNRSGLAHSNRPLLLPSLNH